MHSVSQVIENIHNHLRQVKDNIKEKKIPVDKFVITKGMTKAIAVRECLIIIIFLQKNKKKKKKNKKKNCENKIIESFILLLCDCEIYQ